MSSPCTRNVDDVDSAVIDLAVKNEKDEEEEVATPAAVKSVTVHVESFVLCRFLVAAFVTATVVVVVAAVVVVLRSILVPRLSTASDPVRGCGSTRVLKYDCFMASQNLQIDDLLLPQNTAAKKLPSFLKRVFETMSMQSTQCRGTE